MKRSGPIKRKTPLLRKTPLRAGRPKARYRDDDERDRYMTNRRGRYVKAAGSCEARWHPSCPSMHGDRAIREAAEVEHGGWQAHHVLPRFRGGGHEVENLRWLCEWCHHRVHMRPFEAKERGLLR